MSKISQLPALASPQTNVLVPLVDVNDHSQASSGTTKQATLLALLIALGLTGDLSGNLSAPVVARVNGLSVAASPGGTAAFLRADGTWAVPPASYVLAPAPPQALT